MKGIFDRLFEENSFDSKKNHVDCIQFLYFELSFFKLLFCNYSFAKQSSLLSLTFLIIFSPLLILLKKAKLLSNGLRSIRIALILSVSQ